MTAGSAAPAGRDALRTVVGNPALRRIEIAWMLGMAGDAAFLVALIVAAFAYGGPAAVGVLTAIRMAPSILGAPLAGLLAGRRPATHLLFLAHSFRATGALGATLGLAAGNPWIVVAGATVAASAGAFVRPMQAASMPTISSRRTSSPEARRASGRSAGRSSPGSP